MRSRQFADASVTSGDFFAQLWLLLVSLMVFGVYVAWDRSVFALIFAIDRSYMASLTVALVTVMSLHCGWNVVLMAKRVRSARQWLAQRGSMQTGQLVNGEQSVKVEQHATPQHSAFLQHFIDDLAPRIPMVTIVKMTPTPS